MSSDSLFADRAAVLATMHRKEQVMAPILETELGVRILLPENFDSDRFGTFTRDIKRPGDQQQTARIKAESAMELTGHSLAVANEGSFGPHPLMPYISCNRELAILVDRENDLEIVGQALSTATNYSHQQVTTVAEARSFADKIGFPQHGLVAMADPDARSQTEIFKGIDTEDRLIEVVNSMLAKFDRVHLETDMRAMYNPTRMQVIAQATQDLVKVAKQCCPQCQRPGFAVIRRRQGLPCSWCGLPTELTLADIYQCQKCNFSREVLFPDDRETADPGRCFYCNP
ncbi:MAG: hypothetical protein KME17_25535 [Cyanosarcina radialis HA8281-LM2]|jgi:hypothetical protein|nr:hypothetical protein [Cyanosarcina radialis HA8281-LM2]